MNPPGVEALVAVEEDGARGGGVVRGDSEGLFKEAYSQHPSKVL